MRSRIQQSPSQLSQKVTTQESTGSHHDQPPLINVQGKVQRLEICVICQPAGPGGARQGQVVSRALTFFLHILSCVTGHSYLPWLPDFPASMCLLPQGDIHGLASLTEVPLLRGQPFPHQLASV